MKPWGTPALTGYFYKTFHPELSSLQLLRKDEIKLNTWPQISWDLSLWRILACQTLTKALDISGTTAQVAPDLIKVPAILSDAFFKWYAIEWEGLEPYWKSEKSPNFSSWSTRSKILPTTERKLTGLQFLAIDLFPTFLKVGSTDVTFQKSGKQNSFRHIMKNSASIYENWGSQFFRTTTGIQSRPPLTS